MKKTIQHYLLLLLSIVLLFIANRADAQIYTINFDTYGTCPCPGGTYPSSPENLTHSALDENQTYNYTFNDILPASSAPEQITIKFYGDGVNATVELGINGTAIGSSYSLNSLVHCQCHSSGYFEVTSPVYGSGFPGYNGGGENTLNITVSGLNPGNFAGVYYVEIVAGAVLPIELIDFYGEPTDKNEIALHWTTSSEKNNIGFDVEHSIDGREWNEIGFVKGNGTTLSPKSYHFVHKTPRLASNYYRLKQSDWDGGFEYSKIINVDLLKEDLNITLYPNPAKDFITTQFDESEHAHLRIFNAIGTLLLEKQITNGGQTDISSLPAGIYFAEIQLANQSVLKKIIKD